VSNLHYHEVVDHIAKEIFNSTTHTERAPEYMERYMKTLGIAVDFRLGKLVRDAIAAKRRKDQ
jgi:hypothetical protein